MAKWNIQESTAVLNYKLELQGWNFERNQGSPGHNRGAAMVGVKDAARHCGGCGGNVEVDQGGQFGKGRAEVCQGHDRAAAGWASKEGLGMKRQTNMVEVFADISLASGGEDKSVQASWGLWRCVGSRCASRLWPRVQRRQS